MLRNFPAPRPQLGWVAIQHAADLAQGSLNLLDLETGANRSFPLPGRPGFFAETERPGVVLIGLERRLVLFDLSNGALEETGVSIGDDERVIINDGLAIDGGVLFGTKHLEFSQPIAALYYFDCATRVVRTVLGGQTCSNGKLFLRDETGATLIDIDSSPKAISRYRLDPRLKSITRQSLVVAPESLDAYPDGLRPTPDGTGIVVAFYDPRALPGGKAVQFRLSDGLPVNEWIIPGSPRVTCPEFVLLQGRVKLLFTTAVEGMADAIRAQAPQAGTMFLADTPFDALPAAPLLLNL